VVGHPVTRNQLSITAGTPAAPLDGIGVGTYRSTVEMTYVARPLQGSPHLSKGYPSFLTVQTVDGDLQDAQYQALAIYSGCNKDQPVHIKRMFSIAQRVYGKG
jgi:hypothetical protein